MLPNLVFDMTKEGFKRIGRFRDSRMIDVCEQVGQSSFQVYICLSQVVMHIVFLLGVCDDALPEDVFQIVLSPSGVLAQPPKPIIVCVNNA